MRENFLGGFIGQRFWEVGWGFLGLEMKIPGIESVKPR